VGEEGADRSGMLERCGGDGLGFWWDFWEFRPERRLIWSGGMSYLSS